MGLRPAELQFLDAAKALADAEQRTAEDQARRQVRINRRLRVLLAGVAVLLAASLVAGLLAWRQTERADDAAAVADARRLAALALDVSDNDQALLLAVEAARARRLARHPGEPAGRAVAEPGAHRLDARERSPVALDVSPDGTRIAVGGRETTLYDADTLGRIATSDLSTHTLAFRPDGRQLAVALNELLLGQEGAAARPGHLGGNRCPARRAAGFGSRGGL